MPNTQVALGASGWGDDLIQTPTGDLLVLVDTPQNPSASIQLLTRIILTCPILLDQNGNPLGPADDIFNILLGSGVTRLVGAPLTSALQSAIENAILSSIAASASFAPLPAPTVDVYSGPSGDSRLYVNVTATSVYGYAVTLPAQALQIFAVSSTS